MGGCVGGEISGVSSPIGARAFTWPWPSQSHKNPLSHCDAARHGCGGSPAPTPDPGTSGADRVIGGVIGASRELGVSSLAASDLFVKSIVPAFTHCYGNRGAVGPKFFAPLHAFLSPLSTRPILFKVRPPAMPTETHPLPHGLTQTPPTFRHAFCHRDFVIHFTRASEF